MCLVHQCVLFCRAIPVDLLAVPDGNSSIHCWVTLWHFTHTQVVYVHIIILRSSNWSTCIWPSTHPFRKALDNILTLSLLHVHVHVRHVCNNFYMHAHVPMDSCSAYHFTALPACPGHQTLLPTDKKEQERYLQLLHNSTIYAPKNTRA